MSTPRLCSGHGSPLRPRRLASWTGTRAALLPALPRSPNNRAASHAALLLPTAHAAHAALPCPPCRFDRGLIYCTPATAALAAQELKLPPRLLREVALGSSTVVEGCRVTFLDANHCPGAAMLLFEPPGCAVPVLHTGDARLVPAMQREGALLEVRGRADLILDTTFCSPDYSFPPQEEASRAAAAAALRPPRLPRCRLRGCW